MIQFDMICHLLTWVTNDVRVTNGVATWPFLRNGSMQSCLRVFFSNFYWERRLTLLGFSVSAKIHAWCIRMPCLSHLTSSWVVFAPQVKIEIFGVPLSYMTMILWLWMGGMGGTTDWAILCIQCCSCAWGHWLKNGNNKTTHELKKKMGSWVVGEVVDDGSGWGGCRWWQWLGRL